MYVDPEQIVHARPFLLVLKISMKFLWGFNSLGKQRMNKIMFYKYDQIK